MTKPISRSLELFADTRVIPCAHERHAERMLGALSTMQSPLICIELTLKNTRGVYVRRFGPKS